MLISSIIIDHRRYTLAEDVGSMSHRPAATQDKAWLRKAEMAMRIDLLRCERHDAPHTKLPVLTVSAVTTITVSDCTSAGQDPTPGTPRSARGLPRRSKPTHCATPPLPRHVRSSASKLERVELMLQQSRGAGTTAPLHAGPCGLQRLHPKIEDLILKFRKLAYRH